MSARTIHYGGELMSLHADGCISRPAIGMGFSGQWRLTGAVMRNNFGHITRRYSLEQILSDPASIPWQFANGTQRVFVQDYDHGSHREWRSPNHHIA
jgi:hypothetical protein